MDNYKCHDDGKSPEVKAMLNQLARLLYLQESDAADRCFKLIENEEKMTTMN